MTSPQLIIQDFGGLNNSNPEQTSARLIRGGSWKRQRIIVILPADTLMPAKCALSHWNLAFPPNNGVVRILAQGMEVGDAYSQAIQGILNHPELATLGGLYFCKGLGGCAQVWGDPKDPVLNFRPQVPVAGQLIECCGTGMGFTLFRLKMFKDTRLRQPWFKTLNGGEGTGIGTQDLYFWGDARKYGYRCAIDCNVRVGHYDHSTDTMW